MGKLKNKRSADQENPDTTVEIAGGDLDVREESGFYEAYAGFSRNLRTWFIAFGIGAPVLFLTTDNALTAIRSSGSARCIAFSFLGGVLVQILAALLYKTAMWFLYVGELKSDFQITRRYRWSDSLSENYFVEVIFDIVTLGLFSYATIMSLSALA